MSDPLDFTGKNMISFSKSQNAYLEAFEMAASSFAVAHGVPNAQYYHIPHPKENEPSIPIIMPTDPLKTSSASELPQDIFPQVEIKEIQPEIPPQTTHKAPLVTPILGKNTTIQHTPGQSQKKSELNHNPTLQADTTSRPRQAQGMLYPPPLPEDSNVIQQRLLHSWYWAGYYAGVNDQQNGKVVL